MIRYDRQMTFRLSVTLIVVLSTAKLANSQGNQSDAARAQAALVEAYNAGLKALEAKQYQTAIELLSRASTLDPKQHVVWGQLAKAYEGFADANTGTERSRLLLRAVEAYRQAVELRPGEAGYQNNYGLALAKTGNVAEARAAFDRAIQADAAHSASYRLNLAIILRRAGQDREAVETLVPIAPESPTYAKASWLRSVATVAIYVGSAKNNFRDLRGKQAMTREEMKTLLASAGKETGRPTAHIAPYSSWDANLALPGGACSVIGETETSEVQCAFQEASAVGPLRSAYENLIAMAQEALDPLPAGWEATEVAQSPAVGLKHVFKGRQTEVRVEIYRKDAGTQDARSGATYRAMLRVMQHSGTR